MNARTSSARWNFAPDQAIAEITLAAEGATADDGWELKTRLATVALFLGDTNLAEEMLAVKEDPTQRTALIHGFTALHGNLARLAEIVSAKSHADLTSGICVAVGLIPPKEVDSDAKQAWDDLWRIWHQESPHSGTHSASRWARSNGPCRRLKSKRRRTPPANRDWWETDRD